MATTRQTWVRDVKADLARAMAKAGAAPDAAMLFVETLDRNWGDQVGFVVFGPEAERAAKWAAAWARKNLTPFRCYDFQMGTAEPEQREVWVDVKVARAAGVETKHDFGMAPVRCWAVPVVYYPGAE